MVFENMLVLYIVKQQQQQQNYFHSEIAPLFSDIFALSTLFSTVVNNKYIQPINQCTLKG